jgi:hypothetical protein
LQPWRASNQIQWPSSGRFQNKPSSVLPTIEDLWSKCVCVRARALLWRWLGKCYHMSYHYSTIPPFQELFDCPS